MRLANEAGGCQLLRRLHLDAFIAALRNKTRTAAGAGSVSASPVMAMGWSDVRGDCVALLSHLNVSIGQLGTQSHRVAPVDAHTSGCLISDRDIRHCLGRAGRILSLLKASHRSDAGRFPLGLAHVGGAVPEAHAIGQGLPTATGCAGH